MNRLSRMRLVLVQVAPEEEARDAMLDSKVLYQSSASVDCRYVWGTYQYVAAHGMAVEGRMRR